MHDPSICPRCGKPVSDGDAEAGFCSRCEAFTGLCAASFIAGALLATGTVDLRGWPHPCGLRGEGKWSVTSNGTVTVLLCASHEKALDDGCAEWMARRGLLIRRLDS